MSIASRTAQRPERRRDLPFVAIRDARSAGLQGTPAGGRLAPKAHMSLRMTIRPLHQEKCPGK